MHMSSWGYPNFSFCGIVLLTSVSRAGPCSGFLLPFYDWPELAAEFGPMEYLQEFGICLRENEQDKTSLVWGRKEMLSVLSVGEGTCVGFGLLILPKIFNKGIF